MQLDFPMWLRGAHYFDILFLSLSARSGLQILAAHPKLYWNDHCTPGTEWLRLTRKRMHGLGRDLALIVLGETTQAHAFARRRHRPRRAGARRRRARRRHDVLAAAPRARLRRTGR